MATADPLSTAVRLQDKKPDYYRLNRSKSSDSRRKTAAERLEADKWKYVKSVEARQRQNAPENHASPLRNVQSTSALSSQAVVQRKTKAGNNVISDANPVQTAHGQRRSKLNRSNTDASVSSRNSNRFRTRSTTEQAINSIITSSNDERTKERGAAGGELFGNRSRSPKDGRNTKFLATYINKAKESLKSVTSTFSGSGTGENTKTRQSRSAVAKSSRYRSSSVGANVQNHLSTKLGPRSSVNHCSPEVCAVSPRTQLKNARQNLKKVSPSDENSVSTPAKQHGKTFVVVPAKNMGEHTNRSSSRDVIKSGHSNISGSRKVSGRPLAIIDNTVSTNRGQYSSSSEKLQNSKQDNPVTLQQFGSNATIKELQKDATTTPSIANETNNHTLSAFERLKGPIEITSQTTTPQPSLLTPITDSTNPLFSNLPRQRKSWSRAPGAASDYKKNSSRVSFNDEISNTRPGCRKSVSEALEEIFNPLDGEDDMDTAYSSMSPDASVDCKTLLASSSQLISERGGIPSSSSSNVLRGARSKTPESSRSRTPTCDDGISFGANDVDINLKELNFFSSAEPSRSGKTSVVAATHKQTNCINNETTSEKRHNAHVQNQVVSQSVRPSSLELPVSTMLAPRERKEIAPDFSKNINTSSNKLNNAEHINTMKSQNTSSSVSGDLNKPLTALTAADLKPRSGFRIGQPLKPTIPFPISVGHLSGNPKRPNNTPVSPTMSPNKQAARMTPPHGSRSSTPYSSLKRTPTSSHNSSLKRNRQRSKSDVSILQSEQERFFSTMGMDDPTMSPLPAAQDTLFTTAPFGSESDFSFAGASAYVRDSVDELMDIDPVFGGLSNAPSVSIIEKNARVMRWLTTCKKSAVNTSPRSPRRAPPVPALPPRPRPPTVPDKQSSEPPPVPPRTNSHKVLTSNTTKVSDV